MKRYTIPGALGVALLVTLAACGAHGSAATPVRAAGAVAAETARAAVLGPSDVATARPVDLVAGIPVSGTLKPSVDIRIASPIPEVVEAVLVKEGQAVRQGQVLARFRATALEPAALSAEAQRRKAANDYERMQNLFKEGAVSQSDVETAEVALRAAEAAEAQARKRLEEATVRAPVGGVISERHVESGDRVKDGDQLFQLVNTANLEFEATVPSEFAPRVRRGAPVSLRVTGAENGLGGRVARVNAAVDPATRQLKVYVAVPNRGERLVGGLYASGRVILGQAPGALAVPQAGIRIDSVGKRFVLIVERGRLTRRDVTTGLVDEQAALVQVTAGLAPGDIVVIGPAEGLQPGQAVRLTGREG